MSQALQSSRETTVVKPTAWTSKVGGVAGDGEVAMRSKQDTLPASYTR